MVVVEEGTIRTKSRVEERTVNVKSVSIRLEPWQNISWKMFRDKNSTFLRYDRFKSIIIYLIKFVLPSESLLPCFTDQFLATTKNPPKKSPTTPETIYSPSPLFGLQSFTKQDYVFDQLLRPVVNTPLGEFTEGSLEFAIYCGRDLSGDSRGTRVVEILWSFAVYL